MSRPISGDEEYLAAVARGDSEEAARLFHSAAQAMGCFVHITPSTNLPGIFAGGLMPRRPEDAPEDAEGVYLFTDKDEADTAMMNWMGERFDDDVELSMLYVHPDGIASRADSGVGYAWEVIATSPIPPSHIFPSEPVVHGPDGAPIALSERLSSRNRSTKFPADPFPAQRGNDFPPAARGPVGGRRR